MPWETETIMTMVEEINETISPPATFPWEMSVSKAQLKTLLATASKDYCRAGIAHPAMLVYGEQAVLAATDTWRAMWASKMSLNDLWANVTTAPDHALMLDRNILEQAVKLLAARDTAVLYVGLSRFKVSIPNVTVLEGRLVDAQFPNLRGVIPQRDKARLEQPFSLAPKKLSTCCDVAEAWTPDMALKFVGSDDGLPLKPQVFESSDGDKAVIQLLMTVRTS